MTKWIVTSFCWLDRMNLLCLEEEIITEKSTCLKPFISKRLDYCRKRCYYWRPGPIHDWWWWWSKKMIYRLETSTHSFCAHGNWTLGTIFVKLTKYCLCGEGRQLKSLYDWVLQDNKKNTTVSVYCFQTVASFVEFQRHDLLVTH